MIQQRLTPGYPLGVGKGLSGRRGAGSFDPCPADRAAFCHRPQSARGNPAVMNVDRAGGVRQMKGETRLEVDAAREMNRFCNSYTRLPAILDLYTAGRASKEIALALLGGEWDGCDNVGRFATELAALLPLVGPSPR